MPPLDMSMVSPAIDLPSGSLTMSGVSDVDAHRGAPLLQLARDGGADAENDDIEAAPDHVHQHRAAAVAYPR